MANYTKLPLHSRNAIDIAVHQTIEKFSNQLPPKANGLCLYYACLGALVCTTIYQKVTKDTTFYYLMEVGSISIRATINAEDSSKAVNFGAEKPCLENGNFHCWIVGLCRDNQLIVPNEFIDFTSRYYKSNALEQGYQWERDDISNYLWIDNQVNLEEQFGISVKSDTTIAEKAWQQWDQLSFCNEMRAHAIEIYQEVIQSTR